MAVAHCIRVEGTGSTPPAYGAESLRRASTGELMGPSAPRLPGLPLLGFDEAWGISADGGAHGRGCAEASVDTGRFSWAFDCHFPGDPVLPGTFMLEALFQLVGLFGAATGFLGQGRAAGTDRIRFIEAIGPTCGRVCYRIDVRRVSRRAGLVMADGEASAGGRPRMRASGLALAFVAPVPAGVDTP